MKNPLYIFRKRFMKLNQQGQLIVEKDCGKVDELICLTKECEVALRCEGRFEVTVDKKKTFIFKSEKNVEWVSRIYKVIT